MYWQIMSFGYCKGKYQLTILHFPLCPGKMLFYFSLLFDTSEDKVQGCLLACFYFYFRCMWTGEEIFETAGIAAVYDRVFLVQVVIHREFCLHLISETYLSYIGIMQWHVTVCIFVCRIDVASFPHIFQRQPGTWISEVEELRRTFHILLTTNLATRSHTFSIPVMLNQYRFQLFGD